MKRSTSIVAVFLLCTIFLLTAEGGEDSAVNKAPPDTVVYVTNSGRRYHLENCGALRNSRIAVTLTDAVKSGYRPCARCNPPVPDSRTAPEAPALYRVNRVEPKNCEAVDFNLLLPADVAGHVDGDTIRVRIANPPDELKTVEIIRLIGVDTPETVHPQREVEAFGKEASDFTRERLLGKTVYLAFDWNLRDRYGRLLAYVFTEDRRCHNAELIRQGYGHAYTKYPFRFMEEFRGYEREAREQKRGLWNLRISPE